MQYISLLIPIIILASLWIATLLDKQISEMKTKIFAIGILIIMAVLSCITVFQWYNQDITLPKSIESCDTVSSATIQHVGYTCTGDCSGHKAGFKWACENYKKALTYPCGGKSNSFKEGCELFRDTYR